MTLNPTAFDAFANNYDQTFTHSRLGQMLRPRVWTHLANAFTTGTQVLELTCGTGEDATWLAQRGVYVTATDGSAAMIQMTQAKVEAFGLTHQVIAKQMSLQDIINKQLAQRFDGVYSNFGGLNTIADWRPLAQALAALTKPGGIVILVPMGPICPWEILWHLGHGQLDTAFRRFSGSAPARIGEVIVPIWYPSARRLCTDFAPWFNHCHTESLGLWLPPSYLDHLVYRWGTLFTWLNRLERKTASLTTGAGDHYISIFKRRA